MFSCDHRHSLFTVLSSNSASVLPTASESSAKAKNGGLSHQIDALVVTFSPVVAGFASSTGRPMDLIGIFCIDVRCMMYLGSIDIELIVSIVVSIVEP